MINLIDNTANYLSKFRTKIWVEKHVDIPEMYNIKSQIKFETTVLMSSLCDYSMHTYIHVNGTKTHVRQGADAATIAVGKNNKQLISKDILH